MDDVIIGWARAHQVDGAFADSVVGALLFDHGNRGLISGHISSSGAYIADNRNKVVRKFLGETDSPWLMWLDTDIVFSGQQMYDLFAFASDSRRIVGGIYYSPHPGVGNYFSMARSIEEVDGKMTAYEVDLPENELIKVDSIGMGFTVIHRSVFEDVAEKFSGPMAWYENEVIDDEMWGEDVVFCKRAAEVGHQVWAHSGIIVGHRKVITVMPK